MGKINQLKKRNQGARDRYHRNVIWHNFAAGLQKGKLKRLMRRDGVTGEVTEINRSKMNSEICWGEIFHAWRNYSMESSIAWEELEKGATLYSPKASYWLEAVSAERSPMAA